MDEKFEILYIILKDLQNAGVLKHLVLVGSWCQEFYRHHFKNSFEIPATRTMDADILIPRRLKLAHPVDVHEIFRKRGFVTQMHYDSGFARFIHRDLTFEFLTDAGAKADEKQHTIKDLNIVAQELHFMNIPLAHYMTIQYKGTSCLIYLNRKLSPCIKLLSVNDEATQTKEIKISKLRAACFNFLKEKTTTLNGYTSSSMICPRAGRKKLPTGLK